MSPEAEIAYDAIKKMFLSEKTYYHYYDNIRSRSSYRKSGFVNSDGLREIIHSCKYWHEKYGREAIKEAVEKMMEQKAFEYVEDTREYKWILPEPHKTIFDIW